jgi:hypothetical protein
MKIILLFILILCLSYSSFAQGNFLENTHEDFMRHYHSLLKDQLYYNKFDEAVLTMNVLVDITRNDDYLMLDTLTKTLISIATKNYATLLSNIPYFEACFDSENAIRQFGAHGIGYLNYEYHKHLRNYFRQNFLLVSKQIDSANLNQESKAFVKLFIKNEIKFSDQYTHNLWNSNLHFSVSKAAQDSVNMQCRSFIKQYPTTHLYNVINSRMYIAIKKRTFNYDNAASVSVVTYSNNLSKVLGSASLFSLNVTGYLKNFFMQVDAGGGFGNTKDSFEFNARKIPTGTSIRV